MPSATKRIFFNDHVFDVSENVYEPAEDTFLFAESLDVDQNDSVLDIGTGCGILGIIAAEKASTVVAVDLNPYAIRCAKANARTNNVQDKMNIIHGSLFNPIKPEAKFDTILFNAPYLPSEWSKEGNWAGLAWAGGPTGRVVIDRFLHEAPSHLYLDGQLFLMQSTLSNVEKTVQESRKNDLEVRVVAKKALPFFETIVLLKAEKRR